MATKVLPTRQPCVTKLEQFINTITFAIKNALSFEIDMASKRQDLYYHLIQTWLVKDKTCTII